MISFTFFRLQSRKPNSPLLRFWKTCKALPQQVHWPTFLLSSCLLLVLILCKTLGRCGASDKLKEQLDVGCCRRRCRSALRFMCRSFNAAGNLIVLVIAGVVIQYFADISVLADFEELRDERFVSLSLDLLKRGCTIGLLPYLMGKAMVSTFVFFP